MTTLFRRLFPTPIRHSAPVQALGYYWQGDTVKAVGEGIKGYGASVAGAYANSLPLSNTPTGYATAFAVSVWAYRCVTIKARAVGAMTWRVFNRDTGDTVDNSTVVYWLKNRASKLFRRWQWTRDLWGETFFEKLTEQRYPDLRWLNNLGMQVDTTSGYIRQFTYAPIDGGAMAQYEPDELVYAYTDNPFDDLRGFSPFISVMDEIGIDRDVARTLRSFYANDARPGIMLIPKRPLVQADAEAFMAFWKANYQGARNAGKPVLMPQDVTLETVQRAPTEDDSVIREATRREICAAFGVPMSLAGAWDDAQYQSLPSQRQSFYEETIIPECNDIAADFNAQVMPLFDPDNTLQFEFVYDDIIALSEGAKLREQAYAARLASGGITLNEYREGVGMPRIEGGDVLYMNGAITPVQDREIGTYKPPSAASVPGLGGMPIPAAAAASVPPTQAEDDLAAWQRKVEGKGAIKGAVFATDYISADVQQFVRGELKRLPAVPTKAEIRRVFSAARERLAGKAETPAQSLDYWRRYDDLMAQLGDTWLDDYMLPAYTALSVLPPDAITDTALDRIFSTVQTGLVDKWVGTETEPGILSQVVMAGMAAGQESINRERAANPYRPPAKADVVMDIDWNMLNREALEFVRTYMFDLIRGLDATTREQVRVALQTWSAAGGDLDSLQGALTTIFQDKRRARLIAQTESTRAYNSGAFERWKRAGVQKARWVTVRDGRVCPVCEALNGQEADIAIGWTYAGKVYRELAHPGCRCYRRPVLE